MGKLGNAEGAGVAGDGRARIASVPVLTAVTVTLGKTAPVLSVTPGNVAGNSLGKNWMAETQADSKSRKDTHAGKPASPHELPPRHSSVGDKRCIGRSLVGAGDNYQEESLHISRDELVTQ